MKQVENKVDIYYISKPVIVFAKLCGLWPQALRRTSPGVSTLNLIWFFTVFFIYVYAFYANLDLEFWANFNKLTQSNIQTYGSWAQVLSGLLIGMASLTMSFIMHRKQWTLFENMDSVDEMLKKDFSVITPKKVYRFMSLISMLVLIAALLLLTAMTYYVFSFVMQVSGIKICISYFLANLPYYAVVLLFYLSMNAITHRFYYVNNILRQLAPHDIPKDIFEVGTRTLTNERHLPTISLNEIYTIYGSHSKKILTLDPQEKNVKKNEKMNREIQKLTAKLENREENFLKSFLQRNVINVEEFKLVKMASVDDTIEHLTKLLDIHDILLDSISIHNQLLSFQILLIVTQIFVFEVFTLFSLYRTMYNLVAKSNVLAFSNVFWFISYNIILYIIMWKSTECVNEAKFTGIRVHKVINKIVDHVDPRIVEKLSIMSHQLTMRTPDITCGLFSFNWELMFSIISATTIYLIFLMQFDIADNPYTPDTLKR